MAEDAVVAASARADVPILPAAPADAVLVEIAKVAEEVETHIHAEGVYFPPTPASWRKRQRWMRAGSQLEGMRRGVCPPWTKMGTWSRSRGSCEVSGIRLARRCLSGIREQWARSGRSQALRTSWRSPRRGRSSEECGDTALSQERSDRSESELLLLSGRLRPPAPRRASLGRLGGRMPRRPSGRTLRGGTVASGQRG